MPSLRTLTDAQLNFYAANAAKRGDPEEMGGIVCEMRQRGMRCSKYYSYLRCNPTTVRATLKPFVKISQGVEGNQRAAYTELGGYIFQKPDGPEKYWIDAYTAIKRGKVNASFEVLVMRPGMDPTFVLTVNGEETFVESKDLSRALQDWREIAERAVSSH